MRWTLRWWGFFCFFWGVRFRGAKNSFVSIDISTAFLNAELLEGRIVVVKPPACLYQLGLVPPGTVWRLHKALYGLRESPSLWAGERTKRLKSPEVTPANSSPVTSSTPALFILVCGLLSRRRTCSGRSPRKGLRMFFYPSRPQRCLRPSLCFCGWYPRHRPQEHLWRSGQGAPEVVEDWWPRILDAKYPFQILRRQSGDDEARAVLASAYLRWRVHPEACRNLRYPSARDDCSSWTLLHQEFGRATSETWPREPAAPKADQKSSADLRCVVWLSARSRPDLSYAVLMAASVQTRDLRRELEVRLRRLLQHVSSHPHLGLRFPYPTSTYLSLEAFADASLARCGARSNQGLAVLLKVGHSQHHFRPRIRQPHSTDCLLEAVPGDAPCWVRFPSAISGDGVGEGGRA